MGQITIDEPTLTTLMGIYKDADNQAHERLGMYNWPGSPGVRENLGAALPVKAGGKDFTAGTDLTTGIEQVRSALASRVTTFKSDSYSLYGALYYLLQDSHDAENFNSLTAAQWQSYVPQSTTGT